MNDYNWRKEAKKMMLICVVSFGIIGLIQVSVGQYIVALFNLIIIGAHIAIYFRTTRP